MKRIVASVLVAALLALAGCVGSLPGTGPTLDDVEYPNGVSDGGVNATALVDAHEAGLENRSFTLEMTLTGASENESQSYAVRNAVSADRSRMLAHTNTSTGTTDVYFTADRVYQRSVLDGRTSYDVRERTSRAPQAAPGPLTGVRFLRQYLSTANFTPTGVTVDDGTTLIVLTADTASLVNNSMTNVTRFDARVLVDERGVVHRATLDYAAVSADGETISGSTTLRVTDIGETTVTEPDWLDEAEIAANESG